jgi:hypothetical protein
MVDLPGYFWNQVREQLTAWYGEFNQTPLTQMLATTRGL